MSKRELLSIKGVKKVTKDSIKKIMRTHMGDKHISLSGDGVFLPPTWGQDRIDQRSLPLNGRFEPVYNGQGTDIYVVDTGIDTTHIGTCS